MTMCPTCGFEFPVNEKEARKASNAAVMSSQMAMRINTYEVTDVKYSLHQKEGKPDSVRVDYWSDMRQVGSEWLCFEHGGFATGKALSWWAERKPADWAGFDASVNRGMSQAKFALAFMDAMRVPSHITINEQGKFPEIVGFKWDQQHEPDRTESHHSGLAPIAATV